MVKWTLWWQYQTGPRSFTSSLEAHCFRANLDKSLYDTTAFSAPNALKVQWKGLVDNGFDTVDAGIPHPMTKTAWTSREAAKLRAIMDFGGLFLPRQ